MKQQKNYTLIYTLLIVLYYILTSWVFHRNGFEHTESLFYSEKLKILFEFKENTLTTIGTTFPSTVFLSAVILSPFGYLFAPIASSIIFMSIFFYFVLTDVRESELPFVPLLVAIILLFTIHPQFILAAISGRNIAAIMFFLYMLFRSLFHYYKTQTTYYLSLASIFLTGLVFTEINFIWLLLSFFPFIFLVSIDGIKVSKDEPAIYQYYQALNIRSLRRKLANRTVSLYLILFLLPLSAAYLFRLLNAAHAGSATYFLTSQYANWRVTGTSPLNTIYELTKGNNVAKQTEIIFQVFVIFLSPTFILALTLFRGKLHELFTLLTPMFFFAIIIIDTKSYFTAEYYVIMHVIGIAGLLFFGYNRFKPKINNILIVGTSVLSIFFGVYYFAQTNDGEEQKFYTLITENNKWFGVRKQTESQIMAEFITSVASSEKPMLIDDAAAYGIMAYLPSLNGLILPLQKSFVTVIENPALAAEYVCIAKRNNRLHNITVLNAFNLMEIKERAGLKPVRIFETENWVIYIIR